FQNGEDSTTRLEGFTIKNGFVIEKAGGAVICLGASPTFFNCVFENNIVSFDSTSLKGALAVGGGVSCSASVSIFEDCVFTANTAHAGGGLHCTDSSSITVRNCSFISNAANPWRFGGQFGSGGRGGGISCINSTIEILGSSFVDNSAHFGAGVSFKFSTGLVDSCTFNSNEANYFGVFAGPQFPGLGGAIALKESSPGVSNSTFVGNISHPNPLPFPSLGAAIYCADGANPMITSSTFYANIAEDITDVFGTDTGRGSALFAWNASPTLEKCVMSFSESGNAVDCIQQTDDLIVIRCSDIFGNAGGNWVGCIAGLDSTNGNFSLDPYFCDTTTLDLTLQPGSPCSVAHNSCEELIGRFGIGCSGPFCCALAGDADNNVSVNIADITFLIARIFAGGSAPNCNDEADANGDNKVNIADVTFLIARIFAGGPAPICGTTGS
ncbi:MAG: dockerin type I repeat-containing protein, partial [candidate division Zixibacteria bacterium]|nr:dockerin type I repeat-containing protein [candidate division Zixibacteria bacterium]